MFSAMVNRVRGVWSSGGRAGMAEPCFETFESRLLLSVSTTEFNAIKAAHPDLNLGAYASYNIIDILATELTAARLQGAVDEAATTEKPDLIVIRTTATQNKITLEGGQITIDINAVQFGSVTIVSLGDMSLTIDADHVSRVMYVGASSRVALAGLTLCNGLVTGDSWIGAEGEDYTGNGDGGGILVDQGVLVVTNSTIKDNRANEQGGGLMNCKGTVTLTNVTVSGNVVTSDEGFGGGVSNLCGFMTITGSRITGNRAEDGGGGGIVSYGSDGALTLTGSTVSENVAFLGGGIQIAGNTATVMSCIITKNTSGSSGGGIYASLCTVSVTNSLIAGNIAEAEGGEFMGGGGIAAMNLASVTVTNSTIAGNTADWGGGIHNALSSTMTLANSIVAGNTAAEAADVYNNTGVMGFMGSTIHGYNNLTAFTGWSGSSRNNIAYTGKPLFVDAAGGDYRLVVGSQAIDKGDNSRASSAGLNTKSKDLAGNSRIAGKAIDLGAYEFQSGAVATVTAVPVPASVKAKADGISTIVLTWKAPAAKAGVPVPDRYDIYDANGNLLGSVNAADAVAGVFSYRVENLLSKTSYTFRVVAVCEARDGDDARESKAVTVKAKTATFVAPKLAKAVAGDTGLTSITFRLKADANADGYLVICTQGKQKTPVAIHLSWDTDGNGNVVVTITGVGEILQPGTKYDFVIQATNDTTGESSLILKKSIKTVKFPVTKKPSSVKSLLTSSTVGLTWKVPAMPKNVDGAINYSMYYSLDGDTLNFLEMPTTPSDGIWAEFVPRVGAKGAVTMTVTIHGLESNTTYFFNVCSTWSEDDAVYRNTSTPLKIKTLPAGV